MTVIYLGDEDGPRLRDLSLRQQKILDSWLTRALESPPNKRRDTIPIGYTRAIGSIAKRRGIPIVFNGYRKHERHEAGLALGQNIPGCIGGSKRKVTMTDERNDARQNQAPIRVRARDGRGFVNGGWEKLAPYHERDWRDEGL